MGFPSDLEDLECLEDSGDSGFHQNNPVESLETQFYSIISVNAEEVYEVRSVDEDHIEQYKEVRSDIHNKLKDIREHLTELENNLKARKRKINKSLCSQLLRIFYYFFKTFL